MKKIFSMMSIALLMASCASDELESVVSNGNEATVSFSINLNDAVATRAISDGQTVDRLYWEVYDKNGDKIEAISGSEAAFTNGLTHTLNITLAKGQTYTFGFWAQKGDTYVANDLKRVEINYEGVAGNNEDRDAFFAFSRPITVNGNFTEPITLKRPFAQLNLGVSDLDAFEAAGISLNQVEVTISEAAANFDVTTGLVSGTVPVKFNLADVLCNGTENPTLTLKNPIDVNGVATTDFDWVSMNYILVNDATTGAASDNVDVIFTITTTHDDVVLTSTATPIQRNYRTNLIAKLTNVAQFDLVIDPIYDAENNGTLEDDQIDITKYGVKGATGNYYKTLAEAITAGETDIQLAEGEYTLNQSNMSADLKIIGTSTDAKINLAGGDLRWNTATFDKVTIVSPATGDMPQGGIITVSGESVYNNCVIENVFFCLSPNTVFNDCTFNIDDSNVYNVWTYGANVDFNNCVFNSAGKSVLVYAHGSDGTWKTVNFTDCEFNATTSVIGKAAIEIDSSICPYNVDIDNCTATGFALGSKSGNSLYNLKKGEEGVNCNLTVAMADGVNIVKGVYEISNANGMFWLADQVNAQGNSFAGKTLKLTANIDLANKIWAPVGQTGSTIFGGVFDGNDKTISNLNVDETSDNSTYSGAAGLFGWFEGNGPVVRNLTIDGASVKGHHYAGAIVAYCEEGGLIEGCTVKNAKVSCVFNTVTEDDGDKAGAIVGYLRGNVDNCHAVDCQVDAIRDAAQIAGAGIEANVTNCTATNVEVSHNTTAAGYGVAKDGQNIVNGLVGNKL